LDSNRSQIGRGSETLNYPLVSDIKKEISTAYNVLDPDAGVALRGLFIIDKDGCDPTRHHQQPILWS
jgi:alkyl hydroperoxide reductase subunit AhpC